MGKNRATDDTTRRASNPSRKNGRTIVSIAVPLLCLTVWAAGCSSAKQTETTQEQTPSMNVPQGPVTFKVASSRTKESFDEVTRAIKAKFPNVTLQHMANYKMNEKALMDMIAAGDVPDLIDEATTNTPLLLELDLPLDLDPLISKYKIDLGHLDQQTLTSIRAYNGTLFMIPTNLTPPMALFYNKDIFDRFGVPYPKLGSTWSELMDTAQKLSRTDNGVNYMGLSAGTNINRMATQLSLSYIDPKTGRAALASQQGWKTMFETWQHMYRIPGNYPAGAKFASGINYFLKDKTLAMLPHFLFLIDDKQFADAVQNGLSWGVTTFPAFGDAPGIGPSGISGGFMVTKANKYPELGLQVVMAMVSDEAQIDLAKTGMMPSVTKSELRAYIHKDSVMAGQVPKEVLSGIYATKEAKPYDRSKYDSAAINIVTKYMNTYIGGSTDLNTTFRQAEEEINKLIDQDKNK